MDNPLRSEAAMFRVLMVVVVAAVPVIALGLLAGPLWGALAVVFELGIAIGVLWRRRRVQPGPPPPTAPRM